MISLNVAGLIARAMTVRAQMEAAVFAWSPPIRAYWEAGTKSTIAKGKKAKAISRLRAARRQSHGRRSTKTVSVGSEAPASRSSSPFDEAKIAFRSSASRSALVDGPGVKSQTTFVLREFASSLKRRLDRAIDCISGPAENKRGINLSITLAANASCLAISLL